MNYLKHWFIPSFLIRMTNYRAILIEIKRETMPFHNLWHQKIAILIRMHFLNDIIKSRHGFKTAQKFHKFSFYQKFMKFC